MNNLLRPALYDAFHEILPTKIKKGVSKKKIYDIVGPICETSDIFQKDYSLPELQRGDCVIICSAGAYGSCMTSDYNLRGIAKEYFLKGKKIIRKNKK